MIYPASVIKLFYLAATHRWMEDGRLTDTPEVRRAMKDMIVDSSNDATHYLIDLMTGTTSGPELPEADIRAWFEKRNAVTRYFTSLGYTGVYAHKKPWGDGPYGRESQATRLFEPKRNMLTTDDTARLLLEFVEGKCVTPARSREMLELMRRDPAGGRRTRLDFVQGTGQQAAFRQQRVDLGQAERHGPASGALRRVGALQAANLLAQPGQRQAGK